MIVEKDISSQEFEALKTPSKIHLRGSYFHVGPASVILAASELIPRNILAGEPYNKAYFRDNPDYYRVCAANGDIDDLSRFFVYLNAQKKVSGDNLIDSAEIYTDNFVNEYAIAVIKGQRPSIRGVHDTGSAYLEFGKEGKFLPMQIFNHRVPIFKKLSIPKLSFNHEQTASLVTEGLMFFEDYIKGNRYAFPWGWGDIDAKEFSIFYLLFKKPELAVKSVLLSYYQEQKKT